MSEFNYKTYLKEGKLLKEEIDEDVADMIELLQKYVMDKLGADEPYIPEDAIPSIAEEIALILNASSATIAKDGPGNIKEQLSPSQQKILNSLRDELKTSLDPDLDSDTTRFLRNADDIRMDIRKEFGDVIANQIEDGEYEMNFPRDTGVPGFQRPDKLAQKEKSSGNRYRVTKSGKMNKQDVNRMKNQYKRGY